jgi:surface antigen
VFFAGSDGIPSAPGHVAMVLAVTGDGTGQMAEAYATGFPVRVSSYGTASAAPGDETPAGFTRPAAHGGM